MFDVRRMWPQPQAEFVWNLERKLGIDDATSDHAIKVLFNVVHLHLFESSARAA
jgi:hypothetical protein